MKRGWITWDKTELPPSSFESRLAVVRTQLAQADLPAVIVYTDVWRSNQGRYLANFMPYWNRALLVIPRDSAPLLLCGLSPRVYPWIRSVTILDEIRPATNLAQQLTQLRTEKGWTKIGVLDLPQIPYDLLVPDAVDIPWSAIHPQPDEAELSMYRRAAKMAREILAEELPNFSIGNLELKLRRAGAEDVVVLINKGSVSLAMEYRGHWAKITRPLPPRNPQPAAKANEDPVQPVWGQGFGPAAELPLGAERHVNSGSTGDLVAGGFSKTELLTGPYPYECCQKSDLPPGAIFAVTDGNTGDTYRLGPNGPELL